MPRRCWCGCVNFGTACRWTVRPPLFLAVVPAALPLRHDQDRPDLRPRQRPCRPSRHSPLDHLARPRPRHGRGRGGRRIEADALDLYELGCEYVQGFLYGQPMTAAEASKLIFRTEAQRGSGRVGAPTRPFARRPGFCGSIGSKERLWDRARNGADQGELDRLRGDAEELAEVGDGARSAAPQYNESQSPYQNGAFGAISGVCNHVGGPLGEGRLDGDYVVCPWHGWKFHRCTGVGEPGFEADRVPAFPVRSRRGRVLVNIDGAATARKRRRTLRIRSHARSSAPRGRCGWPGSRPPRWTWRNPRFSGSDHLLGQALQAAGDARRADAADPAQRSQVPHLRGLLLEEPRAPAPGPARSRRWMRPTRWTASTRRWCTGPTRSSWRRRSAGALRRSLYFKMAERLNCVQNQITIRNRVLIRNKVAGVHHRRRPGQHPGGGRPDARLLRRARLHLSAVPLHRPFARLVGRGYGEQCRGCPYLHRTRRRRRNAGQARPQPRRTSSRARRGADIDHARRPQSAPGLGRYRTVAPPLPGGRDLLTSMAPDPRMRF